MKKFTRGTDEYNLMVLWWQWLQECYVPESDSAWSHAIERGAEIISKYDGMEQEKLAYDLVSAGLDYLEHGSKSNG